MRVSPRLHPSIHATGDSIRWTRRPLQTDRDGAVAFLALLIGALAVVSLGAGQLSLALFTDQETVAGTFSSGSVILDDVKIDALTLTTAGMVPGDTVTDDVVVENDGSVQLRYALSTSSTNPDAKALRDVLTLTVKTIDVTTPGTPCDNFDGTSVLAGNGLRGDWGRLRQPGRRRPGGRPDAGSGRQRDALLPGHAPVRDGQRLPERDDHDHLHVRRRADREQPVAVASDAGSA